MYQVSINNKEYNIEIKEGSVLVNGKEMAIDLIKNDAGETQAILPNKILYPEIEENGTSKNLKIRLEGEVYELDIKDHFDLLLTKLGMDKMMSSAQTDLKAPMPGLVLEVLVNPGQTVAKGDALLVLEAMKMENVIKAASDATIKEIKVEAKQAVEKNHILITFE